MTNQTTTTGPPPARVRSDVSQMITEAQRVIHVIRAWLLGLGE